MPVVLIPHAPNRYADVDQPCGEKEVAFTLPATSVADGVLRVTVTTTDGTPVAERLTFRKPAVRMHTLSPFAVGVWATCA